MKPASDGSRLRESIAGTYRHVNLGIVEGPTVCQLYLLPDHTYTATNEPSLTSTGRIADEGHWSVQDDEVVLFRTETSHRPENVRRFTLAGSPPAALHLRPVGSGQVDFEQIGLIRSADIPDVREQVDRSVGRYSWAALFQRYTPSAGSIEIQPDGSFVATDSVVIQIGGAMIAADRIEFGPNLDVVRCTGHARVLSGDIGSQPALKVFFEDRPILPAQPGKS